ncbi:MAG: VWA domain-containing protein [Anaerolineae bacterium]
MAHLMRCLYCGLLQDEPRGIKTCVRCGGELAFEQPPPARSYVQAQMELDQINAPAEQIVDRYLVLTIQTPSQVPDDEAAPTTSGREPMGFTAVLDVSGSMRGEKIESAREAVRQAVRCLHDGDLLSLVTFASEVQTVLKPTQVDGRLRQQVEDILNRVSAGGQTALCSGLEAGIEAARARPQETNLVLLLSDGQANVGETDLEKVGERALKARQGGVTTSTLGVGSDYNEALMVEIATQGGGRFYHVLHAHQITPYVVGELGEVSALAARDTALHLILPGGTGLQPFSSAYTVSAQSLVSLGDIPIDTQLEVVLRLLLPPQPASSRLPIEGTLTYRSPAGNELTTPLNAVTLRFVAPAAFDRRDGAVVPVVERVLEQMKARSVLGTVRVAAVSGRAAADERARLSIAELRTYASLLGDEVAEELAAQQQRTFVAMAAAPAAAKNAVSRAYARHRSTKDFDRKK